MTAILRSIGLLGVLIFGLAFTLTFLSPIHYEKAARGFLESKIEQQMRDRLEVVPEATGEGRIARLARALAERHEQEIADIKETLLAGLKERVAGVVVQLQDLDCECRQRMTQALDIAASFRISTLDRAEPQLRRVIEGRYGEIVSGLLRDLRIFTGTNLVAFALLLALSFAKSGYIRQLFVPGILLAVAAVIASGFYLFGQNWFFTLLYNDYVGMAYGVWLLLIYGLLCDVALFKARVTTGIVDGVVSLLGQAASGASC